MKRSIFAFLAVLTLCLCLTGTALAANERIAGYYIADSCEKDGEQYRCDEDYLILYEDGTGIAAFNGEECPMTWVLDGNRFFMEDADGFDLDGSYDGGSITGNYGSYDYVYVFSHGLADPQPTEDSEDESTENTDENPKDDSAEITVEYPDMNLLYCPAVSRCKDGEDYPLGGEYLLFYEDGQGMVVSNGCAYFIDWTSSRDHFSFTDHMGETVDGIVEGEQLTAHYKGYDYIWELSDEYAPITLFAPKHWDADLPNVFDQADILTDEEEAKLGEKAAALTEQYHCKVYIITVDDLKNYTTSHNINTLTDELMTGYRMGYGEDRDAIMLTLSMAARDYWLKADGTFGNASFTDYGKSYMSEYFLDNLKEHDWYGAFSDYLDVCESMMKASVDGKPIDVNNNPSLTRNSILVAIVCAGILSLFITCILEDGMKSVAKKTEAKAYVPEGGFEVTFRHEIFVRRTVSRVYDPPKKSSSSSSGGTSVSSSGRSSSGGKF